MNTKISLFVICVKAIIYLLLCNLHDCTFKIKVSGINSANYFTAIISSIKVKLMKQKPYVVHLHRSVV